MKRREIIQMSAGLGVFGLAMAEAAKLPDGTLDGQAAKLTKEPFGELRIYYDGPTDQLRSMTAGSLRLNAGASPHPPHRHPEEEFMVITEGSGDISVDGELRKAGPGTMMYCAGNKLHGIVNTGKTPLLFYFYKWNA